MNKTADGKMHLEITVPKIKTSRLLSGTGDIEALRPAVHVEIVELSFGHVTERGSHLAVVVPKHTHTHTHTHTHVSRNLVTTTANTCCKYQHQHYSHIPGDGDVIVIAGDVSHHTAMLVVLVLGLRRRDETIIDILSTSTNRNKKSYCTSKRHYGMQFT